MAVDQQMYEELIALRQKLRSKEKTRQGKKSLICSDEAIYKIAEMRPQKIGDFYGIAGIGKTFVDNYGDAFLSVILRYSNGPVKKSVSLTSTSLDTLKELEKKLVSINRRNRLLYMPKISVKYAFDLFEVGRRRAMSVIYGEEPVILCDTIKFKSSEEQSKYKKIVQLLREANKDLRDKGQNDLYIGYPFVVGLMPSEDFYVRAPLVLFPIKTERTATRIQIEIDRSRDIIYNTILLLAHSKFSRISKPIPSEVVENISKTDFIESALSFYAQNGMEIKMREGFYKFEEYKAGEFPKYSPGEFELQPCAVLGKYPICSSSIQRDFEEIIKKNEINVLLNDLLVNAEDIDYYSDTQPIDVCTPVVSEKNLMYINDINSSQEAVLSAINEVDELVVQGPPGTGKSQTITSLIAQFAGKGKTVLMVSEKKTALDVVYSRLGELAKYTLLIDDVANKDAFYEQIAKILTFGGKTVENVSIDQISDDINILVDRLELVANTLYGCSDFGIEPYKLYQKCRRLNATDAGEYSRIIKIKQTRDSALLLLKFAELEKIRLKFSDPAISVKLERFLTVANRYPWLSEIRAQTDNYGALILIEQLKRLKSEISEWKARNFWERLTTKFILERQIKAVLKEYFVNKGRSLINLLIENTDVVIESMSSYSIYRDYKPIYEGLSNNERMYYDCMFKIKDVCNSDYTYANSELYNEILNEHIEKFETNNEELFYQIDNFDAVIRSMSNAIAQKQELTRKRLEYILKYDMNNISMSKRHGEIQRVVENKRKWSVNKFIKKFDFELFNSIRIWLLTPEVVSEIIPLKMGIFDLVVFDEASQMYVEKGVPAILRAKKVVIAGDHKQLRPSNLGEGRIEVDIDELDEDAELTAALEEESLLDLARFKYKDIMLNFHYRSQYEELIAFSNHAFYGGRLYVSPNTEQPDLPPIQVHKLNDARWINRSNPEEAKYVVKLLKEFFYKRKEDETIGIITFNSSQRDLIEDLIDEECNKNARFAAQVRAEFTRRKKGEDIGLFIKNLESVQGDERDVIIFSVGYAKNSGGKLVRNFGWLNQRGGENRLNVAVSRAKKKVHVVTSFVPSELKTDDVKNDGPRILKKYLEYAFAISSGDKESAMHVLRSFGDNAVGRSDCFGDFEQEVYKELIELGYEVDKNIGIGGYTIDLAVKMDGKYVLGIECDSRLYGVSKQTRERDYHRHKYLESRGWRLYRIWSPNWWKDKNREIYKICAAVQLMS